jgi:hypothetical protein
MPANIRTFKPIVPKIYCYSLPESANHNGQVKIGYTTREDAAKRIKEQTSAANLHPKVEWIEKAVFQGEKSDFFNDKDFHRYLKKRGIKQVENTEWFSISPETAKKYLHDFKKNKGMLLSESEGQPYILRAEQQKAVKISSSFYKNHPQGGEFLWNAKPRFGKTLTAYDFMKTVKAGKVLIITHYPAVGESWYNEYEKFLGTNSGYVFVSKLPTLIGKKLVRLPSDIEPKEFSDNTTRIIEFCSWQDIKGSIQAGGKFDKDEEIFKTSWDLIILDESHEGAQTEKAVISLGKIPHKFVLHLSGTPFKDLAANKFSSDAVYSWTYANEQAAKKEWAADDSNPYADMPQLNLFTYQMTEMIKDKSSKRVDIEEAEKEYVFDLNDFFATNDSDKFLHDTDVNAFLNALTTEDKYPFSTNELRNELKHTLWVMPKSIHSANAMIAKLKAHPVFSKYKIINVTDDGAFGNDDDKFSTDFLGKVNEAITHNERTITISIDRLLTGVTVPEWSGVLMLSNMQSPARYIQAAFRIQSPCVRQINGKFFRKERAYVFDFDPIRTLDIYAAFATELSEIPKRKKEVSKKKQIENLLEFLPITGENADGELVALNAEKVLAVPHLLQAREVVNHGFMSNFLFQNISRVFSAPDFVAQEIKKMHPVKKSEMIKNRNIEDLYLDEDGKVNIPDKIIEQKADLLLRQNLQDAQVPVEKAFKKIRKTSVQKIEDSAIQKAVKNLCSEILDAVFSPDSNSSISLTDQDKKRCEKQIPKNITPKIESLVSKWKTKDSALAQDFEKSREDANSADEQELLQKEYKKRKAEIQTSFEQKLTETAVSLIPESIKSAVEILETSKKEKVSREWQDEIKKHLCGFT